MASEDAFKQVAHPIDLFGGQFYVSCLSHRLAIWLMQENSCVRKRHALTRTSRCQQHGCRGSRLTQTYCSYVISYVLTGVIDSEERIDVSARRVDIDIDIPIGVLRLKMDHLGAYEIGDGVVNRCPEENDIFFQQTGVEIISSFAPVGLFDDCRN